MGGTCYRRRDDSGVVSRASLQTADALGYNCTDQSRLAQGLAVLDTGWEDGSQLLTTWVALSDVEEASGPMKFIVGSHRWKDISEGDFDSQDNSRDDFILPPN